MAVLVLNLLSVLLITVFMVINILKHIGDFTSLILTSCIIQQWLQGKVAML